MQSEQSSEGGCARTRDSTASMDSFAPNQRRRRMGIVCIAFVGCAAVVAVASSNGSTRMGGARSDELLETANFVQAEADTSQVIRSVGMRSVMQELLAVVEGKGGPQKARERNDNAQPIELEQTAAASTAPCDSSCKQRKEMIAQKMKSLRDQINRDFSSMIDFGHKAGYLPPPQSIRQQVMDGTLLGGGSKTGANAVPPPPFKEKVSPTLLKRQGVAQKAKSLAAPTSILKKEESHTPPAAAGSGAALHSPAPSAEPVSSEPAAASSELTSSVPTTSDATSAASAATSGGKAKSSAAWAKAFSFIKDTNNPVDGNSKSHADVTELHSVGSKTKADPLKSAEEDKFLKDFEDPASPAKKKDARRESSLSDSSSNNADKSSGGMTNFLRKGSDPLKSAEDDKFLRGFLG